MQFIYFSTLLVHYEKYSRHVQACHAFVNGKCKYYNNNICHVETELHQHIILNNEYQNILIDVFPRV